MEFLTLLALLAFLLTLAVPAALATCMRSRRSRCSISWSTAVNDGTVETKYEGPASGIAEAWRVHEAACGWKQVDAGLPKDGAQ